MLRTPWRPLLAATLAFLCLGLPSASAAERIYYTSAGDTLRSSDTDGTNDTALTFGGATFRFPGNPAADPAGERLAFAASVEGPPMPPFPWPSYQRRLFVSDTDGSNVREVAANIDTSYTGPSWSPDGTRLLYQSTGGSLRLVDDSGGASTAVPVITTADEGTVQEVQSGLWSSDGTEIGYIVRVQRPNGHSQFQVRAYNLTTGQDRFIWAAPDWDNDGWDVRGLLDWSPDGTSILVETNGTYGDRVRLLPAAGGTAPTLVGADTNGQSVDGASFSPDGARVAVSRYIPNTAGASSIYVQTLADATTGTRVINGESAGSATSPSWTPEPATDEQAPTITITAPVAGATYARDQAVNAAYSCADEVGGSGVDTCEGTVPDGQPVDTSALGTKTFNVQAQDGDGNTSEQTVTYTVVDVTAPSVYLVAPGHGAVYEQGNTVTADYSCADDVDGSGIDSCIGTVPSGTPFSTAGGNHTFTVTAADRAGNTTAKTVNYAAADRTAPTVKIIRPSGAYRFGSPVTVDFECTDNAGGSGIASCTGTQADGAALNTLRPGQRTFSVSATDAAGNTTTETVNYTVRLLCVPIIAPCG